MIKKMSFVGIALLALSPLVAGATQYEIDPVHSSVSFKVRHLVSKTTGKFDKFKGTFSFDADKSDESAVNAVIETASVNTSDAKRDKHLKSPDFFDVAKYPQMTFKSTKVKEFKDGKGEVEGLLTLHGVTKPVTLMVELGGQGNDPWGNKRIGFTATTKLNRKDFGMVWNKTLDAGGFMLGDEVDVALEVEAIAAKEIAADSAKGSKKAKK